MRRCARPCCVPSGSPAPNRPCRSSRFCWRIRSPHLCSTAGARGADVRILRNGLLIEVLRTAVLQDAEMRRLDRDQLIARTWRCAWARRPPRSWNPERRSIF